MTTEELWAALYALGDLLKAHALSLSELSVEEVALIEVMLRPHPQFSEAQKFWVSRWWLSTTAPEIAAMNGKLEAAGVPHRISPIADSEGVLLLSSDLLSDREGNYAAIRTELEGLPLAYREAGDFPQPESEE